MQCQTIVYGPMCLVFPSCVAISYHNSGLRQTIVAFAQNGGLSYTGIRGRELLHIEKARLYELMSPLLLFHIMSACSLVLMSALQHS